MDLSDPANKKRTVCAKVSRLKLNDLLMQFDYPDANVHAEKRSVSTTATQKLFMLNSPFAIAEGRALAARLFAGEGESNPARVAHAYRLLFGRDPEEHELQLATRFLAKNDVSEISRWERYAQLLLISNEMLYVD